MRETGNDESSAMLQAFAAHNTCDRAATGSDRRHAPRQGRPAPNAATNAAWLVPVPPWIANTTSAKPPS